MVKSPKKLLIDKNRAIMLATEKGSNLAFKACKKTPFFEVKVIHKLKKLREIKKIGFMAIIKFVPKKPVEHEPHHKGLVVYYDQMDIILGLVLMAFSAFFIYKYFQLSLYNKVENNTALASQTLINKTPQHENK